MTLKDWLKINILRPHTVVIVLIIGVWLIFAVRSYFVITAKQQTYVNQTADLLGMAYSQNNRVMAEALLETLITQGGATSVEVCENSKQVLSINQPATDCNSETIFLERIVQKNISGSNKLIIKARFNILKDFNSVWLNLMITLILIFGTLYAINRIQENIKKDLFFPLISNLLGTEKLEIEELSQLRNTIQQAKLLEAQKAVTLAIEKNNQQVAHDIRSPLSALSLIIQNSRFDNSEFTDLIKHSISRINGIANDLLQKKSIKNITTTNQSAECDIQAMTSIDFIEKIIEEKRIEFQNLDIEFKKIIENDPNILLFIDQNSIARVISNIINNSVEAMDKPRGIIEIELKAFTEKVIISIKDNGRGIPKTILDQLGKVEISYNKNSINNSGHGIGFYNANEVISKAGGKIEIFSQTGIGTMISISLKGRNIFL